MRKGWWYCQRERDTYENLDGVRKIILKWVLERWIILKWVLERWDAVVWTALIWLRIRFLWQAPVTTVISLRFP
jgi:hypothetical protein